MTWTKLVGTDLWNKAKNEYKSNRHLLYHNWDHIVTLYEHAEKTFKFAYDEALDKAILTHDVVYDTKGDLERRSAEWLLEQDNKALSSAYMILGTANHIPNSIDNRLILLDLADFMFEDRVKQNSILLLAEAQLLRGLSLKNTLIGTGVFLQGLGNRIFDNMHKAPAKDQEYFNKILDGIDLAVRINNNVKYDNGI